MKSVFNFSKFIAILVLLVFSGHSSADGTQINQYRLRIPPVNDYLAAIPDLLNNTAGSDNYALIQVITTEWLLRYQGNQVDYDLAMTAFDAIAHASGMIEWDAFVYPIIQSLLDQHKLELEPDRPTLLHYRDWEIKVIPRDFSGDGQPEWLLEVNYQDGLYQQLYAVRLDTDKAIVIAIPLPFFSFYASVRSNNTRSIREILFHDLTGDGSPEWVIAVGGIGGEMLNHGYLVILQWQDGQLIDLAAVKNGADPKSRQMSYTAGSGGSGMPTIPDEIGIIFADVDANGTVEVIIRDYGYTVFTWIPDSRQFRLAQQLSQGVISPFLVAQRAFQRGQYKRAIKFYEQSIARTEGEEAAWEPSLEEAYVALRLAFLYSSRGETARAVNIIEHAVLPENAELQPFSQPIPDLIPAGVAAFQERQSALDLCTVMYNVFDDYFKSGNYYPGPNTYWGETAIEAGCDAPAMIDDLLITPFDRQSSPVDQLEARGIRVAAAINTDLNLDGVDEWLVWLKAHVNPVFFLSFEDGFILARPAIDYPDPDTEIAKQFIPFTLPDDAGQTLVRLYFRDDLPDPRWGRFGTYSCTTRSGEQVKYDNLYAYIAFFRVQEHDLVSTQTIYLCEDLAFEEIFLDGQASTRLQGWDRVVTGADFPEEIIGTPAIYNWDATSQSYLSSAVAPTITEGESFENPSAPAVYIELWEVRDLFKRKQYAYILIMFNHAIETFDAESSSHLWEELLYYRALTLEAGDRPDEALADYVAIYEKNPDSAWGKLALLHLEISES